VMKFLVLLTDHAISDLKGIAQTPREQIHHDIRSLESNPFSPAPKIKRLKRFRHPTYRLRSGNFRVLYRVEGDSVTILRVIDRKVLERITKGLHL
jgi:mRNA-degrading endonuclease RelE of RelBE toxin-antitoxin system